MCAIVKSEQVILPGTVVVDVTKDQICRCNVVLSALRVPEVSHAILVLVARILPYMEEPIPEVQIVRKDTSETKEVYLDSPER